MQGRILYVGAKTDSNNLHRDIQNIEPYGTTLYEQSYHPQSVTQFHQKTFNSLCAKSKSNNIRAVQLSLSGHLTLEQFARRNQNSSNLNTFKKLIKTGVSNNSTFMVTTNLYSVINI